MTRSPLRRAAIRLAVTSLLLSSIATAARAQENVDVATIERIKAEALTRSDVMETMSWLTDVHGPRLANSPNYRRAADWASGKFREWGLVNIHYEPWTGFGRGWENTRFAFQATGPQSFPIIAYPRAWSPGTNGPATGAVVIVQIDSAPDIEKYRGKLAGKFVMLAPPRTAPDALVESAMRYSDSALKVLADAAPSPNPVNRPAQAPLPTTAPH